MMSLNSMIEKQIFKNVDNIFLLCDYWSARVNSATVL